MVKNHFSTLLNRRNAFTGLQWKEDPAIFGFDLFNEPRSVFSLCVFFLCVCFRRRRSLSE